MSGLKEWIENGRVESVNGWWVRVEREWIESGWIK